MAPLERRRSSNATRSRPHVIVVGGGFAGMQAARGLRGAAVDVTVIDRANHNLFQPLLYQVATAMLAPSDIAVPIRAVLRGQPNAVVLLAEVTGISTAQRVVELNGGQRRLTYDFLIVAAGARHSYFGRDDWEANAPGLKTLADALEIRRRFLLAFERAEMAKDATTRAMEQTIVVVGAGPTGVELAGMMVEVTRRTLAQDFRHADTRRTRVLLLEGGPRILPTFDSKLSARARADLEAMGVEVRTNTRVTEVTDDAVYVGDQRVPTRTVLWAAGNAASPLGGLLNAPLDRTGRVQVAADLSIPAHPEVFVVGDLAAATSDGAPVPAVATAANQMGRAAALNVLATLAGRPRTPFLYRDKGSLAVIGRRRAIAQIGRLRFAGPLAFLLWIVVHLLYLVGSRNRAAVLAKWIYSGVTYERSARLITAVEQAGEFALADRSPPAYRRVVN